MGVGSTWPLSQKRVFEQGCPGSMQGESGMYMKREERPEGQCALSHISSKSNEMFLFLRLFYLNIN